jgi:hypothetical protein
MKRLATGEHPAWVWVAFILAVFIFVLHASYSRTESLKLPNIGSASGSVNIA